jgi:hypothetical protein
MATVENDRETLSTAHDMLVEVVADGDEPPRLIILSFEGVDVPYDRSELGSRALSLLKRREKLAAKLQGKRSS